MKTRIVKWNNCNGHTAFKMMVTENEVYGKWWAVPVGWKATTEWERHLIQTIHNGCGFIDLHGFCFRLSDAQ